MRCETISLAIKVTKILSKLAYNLALNNFLLVDRSSMQNIDKRTYLDFTSHFVNGTKSKFGEDEMSHMTVILIILLESMTKSVILHSEICLCIASLKSLLYMKSICGTPSTCIKTSSLEISSLFKKVRSQKQFFISISWRKQSAFEDLSF